MKSFKGVLVVLLAFAALPLNAQLVINEVMQSNVDCVMDDQNEFPDSWVELYNTSEQSADLSQYSLGLTENVAEAYRLPSYTVAAKGHVLIYCDKAGKDRHADFRLESGKDGSVFLFRNGEVASFILSMKKQPAPNISYGSETDGSEVQGYMLTPTPGKSNSGGVVEKKMTLGEPVFSVKGGVWAGKKDFKLYITPPDDAPEGTVVKITTDGTEPVSSSITLGKGDYLQVNSSRVVRAKLFCDGWLSPRSTTQSYIMHGRDVTLPVISITTDRRYFYDKKLGIYVDGTYSSSKKNYEYDWRRPVNVEFFPEEGEAVINQLCETRITGGASRSCMFKSLALYANKRFGEKRLEYEFFPDVRPGVTDFKSIMLRNSGNDFDYMYFRDAVMQYNMASRVDLDWQAYRPAIVYLNGSYLCMLNIRERSNEDNIYTNYDGLEDIDMIENLWELKAGTWDEFNRLKDFYTAAANEENTNMDNYAQMMELDEYLNLMILRIFHNDLDFPGNNIVQWRPRTEGGKWRWIVKDTDFGLGLYGRDSKYKYIDWLYDNNFDSENAWANKPEHTRLFRRLMADQRFKDRFIDFFAVYLSDFLNATVLNKEIDAMYNVIKTEYPYHRKLINQWWPNHQEEVSNAKTWVNNRNAFMWGYLKDCYGLNTAQRLLVNQSVTGDRLEGLTFRVNGATLSTGKVSGKMFGGRDVTVSAEGEGTAGVVEGWTVMTNGTTETYTGSSVTFRMPLSGTTSVNAIINTSGIESISGQTDNDMPSAADGYYTIDGKKVAAPNKNGIYIERKGNKTRKIVGY